ncbi:MAG: hypothetical protein V1820_04340 [archaeon]
MDKIAPSAKRDANTYLLIQLKNGQDAKSVFLACREFVGLPGVVAASSISGIFDIVAKVYSDEEGRARVLSEIRGKESVEFVAPFEVSQVYLSGTGVSLFNPTQKDREKTAIFANE